MEIIFYYLNNILLYSNENLFYSIFLFFIFLLIYSMFSLPGLIVFITLSGYLFGIYYSFIISLIAISFGSLIFFLISKLLLKNYFLKNYKKYTKNINEYISKSTIEYLIIFRIIGFFPLILQNIILSLLNISISKFIIASLLGFAPIIFISVYVGNKIKNIQLIKELSSSDIITWDFIFFILIIVFILILRIKFKKSPHK